MDFAMALEIAEYAHRGQTDLAGKPYILHPLRVMTSFKEPEEEDQRIVALLHDALEDAPDKVNPTTLCSDGFSDKVIEALIALTKRPGQSLEAYAAQVRVNPLALEVKLADIADNSDLGRLEMLPGSKAKRLSKKYAKMQRLLTASPIETSVFIGELDEKSQKREAYRQRNVLVRALASIFPSGIHRTTIPDWDPEWEWCVYLDLPTGQASYHYHESQAELFMDLPMYEGVYDGHDKAQAEQRILEACGRLGILLKELVNGRT